jgi:hypothetical protein
MLFNWRASLFDGALQYESKGFFDDNGLPPWDTWCGILQVASAEIVYALVSYVPPTMSDLVSKAVNADASESLSWLQFDENEVAFIVGWGIG